MYIICKDGVPESYSNDYTVIEQYLNNLKTTYSKTDTVSTVTGKFYTEVTVDTTVGGGTHTLTLINNSEKVSHGYVWNGTVIVTTVVVYTVHCVTKELRVIVNERYDSVISELKERQVPTTSTIRNYDYEPLIQKNELSNLRSLLDRAISSRHNRINNSDTESDTDNSDTESDSDTDVQSMYVPSTCISSTCISSRYVPSVPSSDTDSDSDTDSEFENWYYNNAYDCQSS